MGFMELASFPDVLVLSSAFSGVNPLSSFGFQEIYKTWIDGS